MVNKIMLKKKEKERTKQVSFSQEFLFWSSIKENDIKQLGELIKNMSPNDINKLNQLGLTPLHQAVIENSIEIIALLLDNEANVNCVDENFWTPLHCSARIGLYDVSK